MTTTLKNSGQGSLGQTIKKSIFRLAGTFFGIIVGVFAAYYIFEPYEYSRFFILVLFFIGIISIQKSYALTIFFVTIGLCGLSFLIFNTNEQFIEFILGRFLDTLIGITILVLLEILIFPYSVVKETRKFRKQYWSLICDIFSDDNAHDFEARIKDAEKILDQAIASTTEYRYEPVSLFNKNYTYQREYFAQAKKIQKNLNKNGNYLFSNNKTRVYIINLADFLAKLNMFTVTKKDFDEMAPIPIELHGSEIEATVNKIKSIYYEHLGF